MNYPATKQVCEHLDAMVLKDLDEPIEAGLPRQVFYIGVPGDLDAGLRAQWYTPAFSTEDALERYCANNLGRLPRDDGDALEIPDGFLDTWPAVS